MSNELATHLICVLNASYMHFNALKRYAVLPVKTRLNAKKLLSFKRLNPQRLNVLKMHLNAEKLNALKLIKNALCV